ncbi:hypothetical protein [Microbulbifer sp. YPW16]|uniref:hypothetical protein n=1 Tax=Microbulbifer sp. YPW16 TaxID=2904242 RepID=UPI001E2BF80D|nr:hypothetical protein [Microbulbifer sp. YPW16]UHQ56258.1 hypothetical protein LVE68_04560 [Microbulbifer sp. YPW16]
MDLSEYFVTDDGSLPEVQVSFSVPSLVPVAFKHLYDRGARNVTANGGDLWIKTSKIEKPFLGHEDAALVASGDAEAFHVVLAGIAGSSTPIPDLGVFVYKDGLDFDYRMGAAWGKSEIQSFLTLLGQLCELGGQVSVPWWGADGEQDFLDALSRA